ncbi:Glycine C-acetyltransferase/2-amino-3-ketobutyrate-CoA ligase [Handroanthus impetiginosus]|uniref:Glycine C-acetyltransferase/2-amino-3-ketobutyrate-CoA ligase n=1 Tax=Handroanthus impetiginosus TaxID=429701 RepID=A0A2G9GP94_9LAMI|nr:Glycine C-acetyltransferase/2-amino-3-ketobutyrate-CoA ligase [Handroanthus impetiginosus]
MHKPTFAETSLLSSVRLCVKMEVDGWLWDTWVEEALSKLESLKVLRSLRPIHLPSGVPENSSSNSSHEFQVFDGPHKWDRASVEVNISEFTFHKWLHDVPSSGDDNDAIYENVRADGEAEPTDKKFRKLIIFSGNDYLGLSSHPMVSNAASKAAHEHGMGPRGSALICGYTSYHRLLESALADLKRKEDCLLCPTGFSANMAFMTVVGNMSLLSAGGKPSKDDKVAIFSDALNHASIIDGIRLAERQGNAVAFVYRHCDMCHLDALLSSCPMKKRVVVTDSLFSMDGDFAPMNDLAKLRKKHGFLFVIDDAHATFVCGRNGGGAAEKFNCENDVDICIGTLSKAAGCHGGFIACSKKWKLLIQSRGRSFIFSTATPVPVAAAAHAAVVVTKEEAWRRNALLKRVQDFRALTGIPVQSHIISLVVGSEDKALQASRHLLKLGFHITAIRPPTVPPNSCRLRVTLSAVHTKDDLRKLTDALAQCISFQEIGVFSTNCYPKL